VGFIGGNVERFKGDKNFIFICFFLRVFLFNYEVSIGIRNG
jgi:hypothetical protein